MHLSYKLILLRAFSSKIDMINLPIPTFSVSDQIVGFQMGIQLSKKSESPILNMVGIELIFGYMRNSYTDLNPSI